MSSIKASAVIFLVFFLSGLMELSYGQIMAPSPAVAPPPISSDGKMIDQGIAYVLMLVALLVTYLIH
ncbi:Arabinogalactan peptide 22 [Dendrobium catenatum]|uniref:Arabinogalactan peptide 22 n=1 Tax=Dendrobium catenatum TaxID=906689 RepID=A0A2I0W7N8_9ASPA|nr:Arabinogalactan peptide 22 [Dendrobium catenatum]